jgi:beta-glucosidase
MVVARLSDRVDYWITHNEPWVAAFVGHLYGEHAPGMHNPFAAVAAMHHLLLSHGLAVSAMRAAARQPLQIGPALNLSPVYPAKPGGWDERAVRFSDAFLNRIALDPLLKGEYPSFLPGWIWRWLSGKVIQAGDLQTIAAPIDFLGVNYYRRTVMRYAPLVQSVPVFPKDYAYTDMGWEIYAPGLYDLLLRLQRDYAVPNIFISENGAAMSDELGNGRIHDTRRIEYLREHMVQTHRAIQAGVPVRGYLVWSLLDNFEWAYGYSMRFGLVYVDFKTQQRIIKDSGLWYAEVIRQNGVAVSA